MFKSYDIEFDNLFNPKIEVLNFQMIEITEQKTIIQPKFADKVQNDEEKQTKNVLNTEIDLPEKTNMPESFSFPSIIGISALKYLIFKYSTSL